MKISNFIRSLTLSLKLQIFNLLSGLKVMKLKPGTKMNGIREKLPHVISRIHLGLVQLKMSRVGFG